MPVSLSNPNDNFRKESHHIGLFGVQKSAGKEEARRNMNLKGKKRYI
jgi:hypothetical protein